eukprot:11211035-Lingulodinium_polyedra.AAC.1
MFYPPTIAGVLAAGQTHLRQCPRAARWQAQRNCDWRARFQIKTISHGRGAADGQVAGRRRQ